MNPWTARDGSDLPPFAIEAVEKKVAECYQMANNFFKREIPVCAIEYGMTGGCAGKAYYRENKIRLHSEFLLRQFPDMIADTVPHEVAHLVTHQIFRLGKTWDEKLKIKPHGPEWRTVMVAVFGIPAKRCHGYEHKYVLNKAKTGYRIVPVNPHTKKRGF